MKGKTGRYDRDCQLVWYCRVGSPIGLKYQVNITIPETKRRCLYLTEFHREKDAQICVSLVKVELAYHLLLRDLGREGAIRFLDYLSFAEVYAQEIHQRGKRVWN